MSTLFISYLKIWEVQSSFCWLDLLLVWHKTGFLLLLTPTAFWEKLA